MMQTKKGHQNSLNNILNEPIAIIGMNCQFPGINADVEDVDAFYEMLLNEQTSIKDVPENRWDINQYYDPDRQKENKIVSRKGGFLHDPQLFDAAFFKISPTEAKQMDPQQRLFLEVSVRALNHANIPIDSLKNSNTGVYCGVSTHDYSQLNYKDKITFNAYTYIGSADSAAPGRLSHFLNLKGPCMTVDTACSSSLSALYLATMALRNQQCDMAIVGGVHLSLCPEIFIGVTKANMLSALGQCSSFDAAADGYARSEGCAVVVIKRLRDALKDNNKILAVIKSIVMNQDGGGGMGMAAPNIEAQITMHQAVLAQAHLAASDIDYIETHGTGTIMGDSVEFNAIQHIHQGHHTKDNPLIVGALKSNLGHTISASGIASVIKVVAALNHELIPANLHYTTPSPSIDPESIPALLPIQAIPFAKQANKKRYTQVSNFGFTGTNVSALIEEPPDVSLNSSTVHHNQPECFVLSAHSEYSLKQMLASHLCYLKESSASLHDVCSTLINCRDHYKFRCAIIADNKEELIKKIEAKTYVLNKVTRNKDLKIIEHDAQQVYEHFLAGDTIRFDKNKMIYQQVDLPLYFFDRKTYWHDKENNDTAIDVPAPKDWIFHLEWQQQVAEIHQRKPSDKPWLLIGAKQLAPGFIEQGLSIVLDEDNHSLDTLDGIIFAADFESVTAKDIETHIDLQKNTLKKLLNLVQELQHKTIELRLIILTTNTIPELSGDILNLDCSVLLGFCKTLALELPQYQTMLIDLDKHDAGHYSTQIMNEIHYNHGQNYEHVVAYRNGQRWVSRLKRTTLPEEKRTLRGEGRYLITGGTGGLGLVTAQALLSVGAKELILVSRHVDKPELKARIKKIQSFYPNQIIRTVGLDITDKEKLHSLLLESNADGLLKGIVHAAGISMNAPLLAHQEDDIDSLFSAKIKGGWYLHELSQHCDLDFFIVYSSISSVFGSNKESVYSGTNSFLDALIAERRRLGLVGTAIQWGPWAEAGMAEKRARDQGLKQAFIHNDQGRAFINLLISSPLSHVTIISPEYLSFMLDFVSKPRPLFYQHLADDLAGVEHKSNESTSPWLNDYMKMGDNQKSIACKNMVSTLCKKILGLPETEELEEHEGFFELGFDSLMVTEIATRLKEKLQPVLNVTATIGFDYPSINKLAQYVESELQKNLVQTKALRSSPEDTDDSIAIISMSCSLPNAADVAAFETLLEQGLSGVQDIPLARWDNKKYYDPDPDAPGKSYITKLGLIDNIKAFDAQFFGISPREAPFIDPQQRLFLEQCYQALENANYCVHSLRGSLTGVFAGVGASHEYYSQLEQIGLSPDELGMYAVTGKALNMIPGRVTYTFDFKGPAVSFDTACSSSLVAIHYACQSLKTREIDFALAGGVNVLLRPESIVNLCKAKALSLTSQCKTFDAEADGYVRAEGCGVLFLKRLADAVRDKDPILAVIKASAISNDGRTAGLTVPNGKSQEAVMRKALGQSTLARSDISYIETHGTGTPLGDPIEVHAINQVYGGQRSADNPLYLGAVKTNLGHLESAAGVASMIKVILSLQKGRIYKNINFHHLNPKIQLDNTRLALHTMDWHSTAPLKCAGINAFGFSGTNAHVIVQEFPTQTPPKNMTAQTNALVFSAKSQDALDGLAQRYQQYLATTSDAFADICFTAATCREHYAYRLAVVAQSTVEASQLLQQGLVVTSSAPTKILDVAPELAALVREYLQGGDVDWRYYYTATPGICNKVMLPNYAFARREFWLDKKAPTPQVSTDDLAVQYLYELTWNPLNNTVSRTAELPKLWVIARDEVRAEKVLGGLEYQLIKEVGQFPEVAQQNIVVLYEQDQFPELLHWCQQMFQQQPARFILVTENAYAINDKYTSDRVNPYHTMASAFWKSFRNELAFTKNYTVDLDAHSTLSDVLRYIVHTTSTETQFAVRDTLYVPRLKKKQLPVPTEPQVLFDREASYLITGGTGGLGKPLMEYLIARGAKHLIITSRTACTESIQAFIEQVRKKQVSITHQVCDASNLAQMEQLIQEIERSAYPLRGVFHLAGVIHDELLVHLSAQTVDEVLQAKMNSALILHQLTQKLHLDCFVLFSSAASILGAKGQANYVAANGFLDGLAHLRHQQGLPALAINWGAFHTLGMAAQNIEALEHRGFIPLPPERMDVLDVLLPSHVPQIVVCPIHWDVYFKNSSKPSEFSALMERKSPANQLSITVLQQQSLKERVSFLSQTLSAIAADVLGLEHRDEVGLKNDLFAMGMDSLMALELRNRVHDQLGCPSLSLPIEYFINEPRIDKIAKNIAHELDKLVTDTPTLPPTASPIAEEVALCDFQYVFWVLNKMGHPYNMGTQLQIHGTLNKEYVAQAFDFIVKQNSVFWLSINKDVPVQTLRKEGLFKLIYEDISLSNEHTVLHEEFQSNMMSAIPLTEPPLMRVYLYKINSELHELHIVMPHIIVDGTSCGIIFNQFKKCYEALFRGKKMIHKPEEDSFLDYVKKNNRLYETNLKDKVNFWRHYNHSFKMLSLRPKDYVSDTDEQEKYLFHYPLDSHQVEQFIEWHKTKNINVSTGLIAACHIALYKLSQQKKMPFVLIHSGREGSHYNSIVGVFVEYKRINLTLNEKDNFIDFVKSIEEQFLITAPYQKCSHIIKNREFKGAGLVISHYLHYVWNKLLLQKDLKKSKLHSILIDYLIKYFSWAQTVTHNNSFKNKLNQLLKLNIPLRKPERLRVLVNITPSFFSKIVTDKNFANLNYEYPSHYSSENRPISNRSLWILFSKDQDGQYQLSINGPLTPPCKDEIAHTFNKIMAQLLENDECTLGDFLR
ncbi:MULTISPECIES: SDR family NAD(P)-dependent oxidoreductase [Legionella]|uniref:SDR family NAD(P)-dependent oxidoreductase n=1 Tax=Legionella TaxID=445 RepID=UPI0023541BC3|nr:MULTISPECIES: SDR family NAD(P)-dependent oxidoreductase [Legionella]